MNMHLSSIITEIVFAMALCGCAANGSHYYSGEDGPVDCKNFPIQSERPNLLSNNTERCIRQTADDVQYSATAYIRRFQYSIGEGGKIGHMNVVYQVALGDTFLKRTSLQALLSSIDPVRTEAADWEKLSPTTASGREYELQRFHLSNFGNSCIGFVSYENTFSIGYKSMIFGYSCIPRTKGVMKTSDVQTDLDGLRMDL
jgi:hypothetical protein